MDVTTAMRRAATFFADREAVVHGKDRLTFAQAWERGCRMANGLMALALQPGDRVAVLEDNSKEAADFFLGAGIANLVRVPLYPRNSPDAHLHMVGHTGCAALVVAGNMRRRSRASRTSCLTCGTSWCGMRATRPGSRRSRRSIRC